MTPSPAAIHDPVARLLAAGALAAALLSLLFSMGASSPARSMPLEHAGNHAKQKRPKKLGPRLAKLKVGCPIADAVDLGTWCLESSPYPVEPEDVGKVDYLFAAQTCVEAGGWLPSAAQLIGAAPRAKLESTIDDNPVTSATNEFPNPQYGIKDAREMSGDLFTTDVGARAAGSEGVTPGSKGDGNIGEPDPVPVPAEPVPETLDYVTVYDNHNHGGFAGGVAVGASQPFRCAYAKGSQGRKFDK
jgi:hypothetical protein